MLNDIMNPGASCLVSVCLITYNQEQFIAEAIESALMQKTSFDYEIVISDDCSTDGTREICESYVERYPDIVRILPKAANVGLKKNFVKALAACKGKYVAYLEGDDKWTSSDKLARQIEVLENDNGIVLVHTDWVGFDIAKGCYESLSKFAGSCIRERESGINSVAHEFLGDVRFPRGSTILFRKVEAQSCIDNDAFAYITSDFPAFDFQLYQDLSVMGRFYFIDELMLTANLLDSLSSPKNFARELDFRSKALYVMAYYINKYSIPDHVIKIWARRQLHYFTRFPFEKGTCKVIPTVLCLIEFIVGIGGVPTFRQRVLILLMRSRYIIHLLTILRKTWGIKNHFSYKLRRYRFLQTTRKSQFTTIYNSGGFGGSPSLSGVGSDLDQTIVVRNELQKVLKKYSIKSMLDAPCGDMYWMQYVDLNDVNYLGADIVDDLIKANIIRFGGGQKNFVVLDIVQDELPQVDLIFCRDCLIHLKLTDAKLAIQNFKNSGSKWLLTTTYTSRDSNAELGLNFFRTLNLQCPPFSFPPPVELINENCTHDDNIYSDKALGLWRLSELP